MVELESPTGRGRAASPTFVMLLLMTASFSEVGKGEILRWRYAVHRHFHRPRDGRRSDERVSYLRREETRMR